MLDKSNSDSNFLEAYRAKMETFYKSLDPRLVAQIPLTKSMFAIVDKDVSHEVNKINGLVLALLRLCPFKLCLKFALRSKQQAHLHPVLDVPHLQKHTNHNLQLDLPRHRRQRPGHDG